MSLPLIFASLWVLAATFTAMLPMRLQFRIGMVLVVLAPVLIIWMSYVHGWGVGVFALLAFVSMFRRPLGHFLRRFLGTRQETQE